MMMQARSSAALRFLLRGTACVMFTLCLALTACGGGGSLFSGVGSGGTGLAEGTISGFGSVIVDGIEYDDSQATVFAAGSNGSAVNATLRLGQRVRVLFDGNVAKSVQVLPQLAGPVTLRADAQGWLQVMGQWVRLVLSPDDPSRSTVTVLSGFASVSEIGTSDDVEVHGSWVFDAGKGSYVLWATRLDKLPAAADPVQLGGVVQNLAGVAFNLSSPAGMAVRPTSAVPDLANGQVVRLWVARAGLGAAALAPVRVERATLTSDEVAAHGSVRISGLAASFDAPGRTVEVQGLRVQLPADVAVDESGLSKGQFVSLEVAVKAGRLVALSAAQRGAASGSRGLGGTFAVTGVVNGVDWTAAIVSFTLRGIDVRAARSTIEGSCPAVPVQAPVRVQVQGQFTAAAGPLVATRVTCG